MKTKLVLFCTLLAVIAAYIMVSAIHSDHDFWKNNPYHAESIREYDPKGIILDEEPFIIRKIPSDDLGLDEKRDSSDYNHNHANSIGEVQGEFDKITADSLKIKIMMFRVTLSYGKEKTPLSEPEGEINEWLSGAGRDFEIISHNVSPTGHDGEVLVVYHYLSLEDLRVDGVEKTPTTSLGEIPNDPFKDWKP